MIKAFNILPDIDDETDEDEVVALATPDEEEEPPAPSQNEIDEVNNNLQEMVNQYFTMSSLHLRCPIHLLH